MNTEPDTEAAPASEVTNTASPGDGAFSNISQAGRETTGETTAGGAWKRGTSAIGVVVLLALKWLAKLKVLGVAVVKFLPLLLKTGGTMLACIWLYAMTWGWWFALGFVLLIFVHECGHLVAARRFGLKVGAPVFIPFMGAFIALKEAPRDAWIEAVVGIGGPLWGAWASGVCHLIFLHYHLPIFGALAYSGYFLNLFNLVPLGQLDGGRIVSAISPWLWVIGLGVLVWFLVTRPNFLLGLILILSLPRLFSLFRRRSADEQRYFEVAPQRRLIMAGAYFGLIALLGLGMHLVHSSMAIQ
jgi:Zn-dependent protease